MFFWRWPFLAALSALLIFALDYTDCPASRFMGPMLAGIFFSVLEQKMVISDRLFALAQGFLGIMIAGSISGTFVVALQGIWPYFVGGTLWAIGLSLALGLVLAYLKIMPGQTSIWLLSPGAASLMAIMSAQYGADMRLVAFAQYLRVVLVSFSAILVSKYWIGLPELPHHQVIWFPPMNWPVFFQVVFIVLLGLFIARKTRFPGGLILVPMILAALFKNIGKLSIDLPFWLMSINYAVIGWKIGLSFSRQVLLRCLKVFPAILISVLVLILGCGLFAWIMVEGTGMDPLTAYLASSPGGLDAVIIIASGAGVDLSLVMAMQTVRLFLVLLSVPALVGYISRKFGPVGKL